MILDDILEHKRFEVAEAKARTPLSELEGRLDGLEPTRGFAAALRGQADRGTAVIAEVKKGSPSKGIIRADFDPVAIARSYLAGGAACLSVLTDRKFFFGDLDYLGQIRREVPLPLLRKDFVVDPYQIVEARAFGADAVLLIAAALEESELKAFAGLARDLGLDVLLEVHDEAELEVALRVPVELVGINNRNLRTFATDLATTERLLPRIPAARLVVSESGIGCRSDILRLQKAGAGAFLVGESLMRQDDVAGTLRELLGEEG
ncbi:MAG: indole-3-glycerol phosphate synthase TrpC [Desulfuromonas sp.]|uniref:indole-3-glycerol phosphate synthase TrpC n=1 Tax=Desulfuromonas sp. TaxID=892 RepID=UPI000CC7568A|nr:indole-3-glycerol phosphate synthase TrpC [Desulfuromonas sp.]PLX83596.1 MAG: indole-3-glycerol phosphate synthase TrpC [Desulfuromonas sp.]